MNETVTARPVTDEEYFTVEELSKPFKLDPTTIRKMFVDEPGVIRMGHAGSRNKRQYYTLRIPASVVQRVFSRMKVGRSSHQ